MHFKLTGSFVLALAFIGAAIPIALPDADADASTNLPPHHLSTPLTPAKPDAAARVYAADDVNLKAIGAGYKRDPNAGMQVPLSVS